MTTEACPVDTRVICTTSGEICPARLSLLNELEPNAARRNNSADESTEFDAVLDEMDSSEQTYAGEIDDESDETPLGQPQDDPFKLRAQLFEYGRIATLAGCGGPINEDSPVGADCPTRIRMENSRVRTSLLQLVRKVIHRI